MRERLFLFLFILIPIASPAQTRVADSNSLLWKVSNKEMKKASYLFGTIHLICEEDYLWTNAMKKSLSASEAICFEMDMDDPTLMTQVAMGMLDQSGKQLKDYFTEEQYTRLAKFVEDS